MPEGEVLALCLTAAAAGFIHTLLGPDHYLPFLALSRAGRWSLARTLTVTGLCGVGHVLSSVAIGALGIAFGWAMSGVEAFEAGRGNLAGWLLLGFGVAYLVWGLHRAVRHRHRGHVHVHPGGPAHFHAHPGKAQHVHPGEPVDAGRVTPWILFIVFVFGPCEILIPLLMVPAVHQSTGTLVLVATVFGVATITTMLGVVTIGTLGLARLSFHGAGRWVHALSGLVVALCGAAILFGL